MALRLALLIANSQFDDERLRPLVAPSLDVEAMANVLRNPEIGGFDEATFLVDETAETLRRRIALLYHRRTREDLVLLYYSGHGIRTDTGELYLASRDTDIDLVRATALDAGFVRNEIDDSNSRRKVVILDCCHSGAFAGTKDAIGSSVGTKQAFEGSGFGRVILTASDALQVALDGERSVGKAVTSVFTRYLVEGLQSGKADRNGDGQVTLDELYEYIYEQIKMGTESRQTPQKWEQKIEGQIIIARNPRAGLMAAELPADLAQAIEHRWAEVRSGAVVALRTMLTGTDKRMALAARNALVRLAEDDSRLVSAAAAQALGPPERIGGHGDAVAPVSAARVSDPTVASRHPSLSLELSRPPGAVEPGTEVDWTVVVHNVGDDDLSRVTVRRERAVLFVPFGLAAGQSRRLTVRVLYDEEGSKTTSVTAEAIASNGVSVQAKATATVQVSARGSMATTLPGPHHGRAKG